MCKHNVQRGFTIIELMVSLAIGLLVSVAAVSLFVSNQTSFNLQKGVSDVGDNGRFAMEYIAQQTRQAGYVPINGSTNEWPQLVTVASDLPGGVAGIISREGLPPLPSSTGAYAQGGIGRSDSLTMQYYTPIATRDCEGDAVPASDPSGSSPTEIYVVNRFFLRADPSAGTGSALVCEGGYHNGLTLTNFDTGNTKGAVLLSSVDNLQILIGVANTAAGARNSPQQYVTIAAYAALPTPRPPISAMRVGMLVSSLDKAGNSVTPPTAATNVLTESIPAVSVPADKRVRKVFASTISFRNVF